jgi:hypothetical protein
MSGRPDPAGSVRPDASAEALEWIRTALTGVFSVGSLTGPDGRSTTGGEAGTPTSARGGRRHPTPVGE